MENEVTETVETVPTPEAESEVVVDIDPTASPDASFGDLVHQIADADSPAARIKYATAMYSLFKTAYTAQENLSSQVSDLSAQLEKANQDAVSTMLSYVPLQKSQAKAEKAVNPLDAIFGGK